MKFSLVSLGCNKNTADSEKLAKRLIGHHLVWTNTLADADLVLLNTCGFIKDAKMESLGRMMELIRMKKTNPALKVGAFGCLIKRYHQEIVEKFPELDFLFDFAGPKEIAALVRDLKLPRSLRSNVGGPSPRRLLTPSHYGYLKISEGCDNRCAYCAIPDIRGRFQSFPRAHLVAEARKMAEDGVRELIVVAQDTTNYGRDIPGNGDLLRLVEEIASLRVFPWIRLQYLHPRRLSEEFLEELFRLPTVLPYFDIPFQHVSDHILEKMNRGVTGEYLRHLVSFIRKRFPRAIIRSTFIVGFPGETVDDFEELTDFLDEYPLDRVGAFSYSTEEGTPAEKFRPKVPIREKSRRLDELMTLQQVICLERNRKLLGKTIEVIIDEVFPDHANGRSVGDAPEVDNHFLIRYDKPLCPGQIVRVKITQTDAYDFEAELKK
jgi:ribosomal protein S12 methylthiotransferase